MLIYLRHGDDRNEDAYRHDRRLTDLGREKATKAAKRLIEKYGHPDVVYVSPFRRALETLAAMTPRFAREVEVRRDRRIAQHLSKKQQRALLVHPDTIAQADIAEDRDAFKRRVAEHVAEVRHAQGLIWCVTHQVVIKKVARRFDKDTPNKLDFLDHVVMVG